MYQDTDQQGERTVYNDERVAEAEALEREWAELEQAYYDEVADALLEEERESREPVWTWSLEHVVRLHEDWVTWAWRGTRGDMSVWYFLRSPVKGWVLRHPDGDVLDALVGAS